MIQVSDLSKSYGEQALFQDVRFQINPRERIGLVGRNGHGKTTLFKIILGEESPDSGTLQKPKLYTVGALEQHIQFSQETVLQEAALGLPEEEKDDHWKAEKILSGLGFSETDFERDPREFSGGFQVRIQLTKALLSNPNLLLLDEPTNYLDIVSIRWLRNFLRNWEGELLFITHDRHFMDSVSTHTLGIHRQKVRKVQGNTTKFFEQLASEEEIYEKTRVNEDKKRKQEEELINRFKAKASKASMAQSRLKALEKKGRLEKLSAIQTLGFHFRSLPFEAKNLLHVHNLCFHYPEGPELVKDFSLTLQKGDRIAIVGPNGRGKSTLLRLLAGTLMPTSGEFKRHLSLKWGHFEQTNVSSLDPMKTVEEEMLSAEPERDRRAARGACGAVMFDGDKALKKIQVLSGGEKARVSLGKLLLTPCHLLLLDEPTNHLDPESAEALQQAVEEFEGAVVMVTHSEGFLETIPNKLVVFDGDKPYVYEGTYKTFLSTRGWSSESENKKIEAMTGSLDVQNMETDPQKKALRTSLTGAELQKERKKVLGSLKNKVQKLEKQIVQLEEDIEKADQDIAKAYEQEKYDDAVPLTQILQEKKEQVDKLFEELEQATLELEEKEKYYRAV
jgi:ATP-binding cassette subfamily F protein 3